MKKYLIIVLLGFAGTLSLYAQQEAQYTQYMYNTISVNPAYAGSRGLLSIMALHRSQWIGLDGAPSSQTLNIHSPLSKEVGLGLSIVNDDIGNGVNKNTYIDAAFSYTIPVSNYGKLSFGLKGGGNFLNIDFTKLRNYGTEVNLPNIDNRFSPNIGAGLYYRTSSFYSGLSVPNIIKTEHFDSSQTGGSSFVAESRPHIYFIMGYVYYINRYWKFKPASLLKAVNGAPLKIDLSANFLLNDKFTFGAAYRWDAAVSLMTGFQLTDQFMLGLAYDRETSDLGASRFNSGSFEVFLRFELATKFSLASSPRFF